jgi:hypothetical protein
VYSNIEIFDKIENNIVDIITMYGEVSFVLMGDFNAKTGTLKDYIEFDKYILDTNFDGITRQQLSIVNLLNNGITLDRPSKDSSNVNNFGNRLIDLCKSINLLIANGRCGSDLHVGRTTCKNTSLVDYVLLSPCVFPNIVDFEICDFDPILSDIHNSISFCIKFDSILCLTQNSSCVTDIHDSGATVKKPIWDKAVNDVFKNSFDLDSVSVLQVELSELLTSKTYCDNTINNFTEKVSQLFYNAADSCHLIIDVKNTVQKSTKRRKKSRQKEWFDDDCKVARRTYLSDKNYYRRNKTDTNFQSMVSSGKSYKKMINKKIKSYQDNINKRILGLKSSDPKAFWNLLNRYCTDSRDTVNNISKEVFLEHFVKLNESDLDIDNLDDLDLENISCNNSFLNAEITIEEIKKVVKN